MPRIKSSIKDVRRIKKRREVNRQAISTVRTALRRARTCPENEKAEVLKSTIKTIDKAVQNGIIHLNTAARYKSRLTKAKPKAKAA